MKTIQLTQNQVTQVSDEDFEELSKFKWCAQKVKTGNFYAVRSTREGRKNRKRIHMHRQIMRAEQSQTVDHKDCHTLNNLRENLRFVTRSQNGTNRIPKSETGIQKRRGGFRAYIRSNGKFVHLGDFKELSTAQHARNAGVQKYYGEYGKIILAQQPKAEETVVSPTPPLP